MELSIRRATSSDALHVAAVMDIAGHGIEAAFWAENAGDDGSVLMAARRLIVEDKSLSYHFSKAHLLACYGETVGGLVGGLVPEGAETPAGFPDFFAPLLELEALASGHWAIIGIAVYPEHRGRGHARLLLNHAENLARETGASGLSLVVEDTNNAALTLYGSAGFRERERRPWVRYGHRNGPENWLLLTRAI